MNITCFDTLNLSVELNRALHDLGFSTPTPIQTQAIPFLLSGKDVIGQAQTGTGKTAAFAIPIIEAVDTSRQEIQAAIVCPTRELAVQVAEEIRKLAKYKQDLYVVAVYGGQPMDRQLMALQKKPQIIVGTPGRMLDHLWRGTFDLNHVKTLVLDEADEMLDMGFREDIEKIFDFIPASRQTVLFSATMPKAILELAHKYLQAPERIRIEPEVTETALIQESYVEVTKRTKINVLTQLMHSQALNLVLVFCNTKRQVDSLSQSLKAGGFRTEGLHGGMPQNKRDWVMNQFRKGKIQILVATDVAARGIDVRNVEAVVNFDIPDRLEVYKHRIGRTGRAGNAGRAFTFVSNQQLMLIKNAPDNTALFETETKPLQKSPTVFTQTEALKSVVLMRKNDTRTANSKYGYAANQTVLIS